MKGGILTICYYDIDVDIDMNRYDFSPKYYEKISDSSNYSRMSVWEIS